MGKKHRRHVKEEDSRSEDEYEFYKIEAVEDRGWLIDLQMSALGTAVLFALYLKTLYPSIPGGDTGELIVSAHELGVAHPPGYPLFTMLAKLTMMWMPWGTPVWRVNVLNALCSAAAGGMLQLTVLRLTGCQGSGLLAIGLFSLSKLTWTWSVNAEVFGLNNLLIGSLLLLAVTFDLTQTVPAIKRISYIGAFLCGLSLTNQHTVVIYVAFLAGWVLTSLRKMQLLTFGMLIRVSMCFLLGLVPYVYLPISSYLNIARWTWGDQLTVNGFLKHLLRSEYGTFHLGKDSTGVGFVSGLSSYLEHSFFNMCSIGPLLALVGTISSIHRKEKGSSCLFVFILMLAAYASFFAWRANLDINQPLMKGVVERFWMQSDMVLTVLACVGYCSIVSWLTKKILGAEKSSLSIIFAFMGAVSIIALQFRNYSDCDFSSNRVIHDFATTLLNRLPENAIVFTKGDLPTNTMRYLHLVEGMRPDLELVDVEIMSYEWSARLRKFHSRLKYPADFWHLSNRVHEDGRKSFTFQALIEANIQHSPLFVCIGMQDKDPSWQDKYILLPFGVCHKIDDAANFVPEDWANITGNYSDDWKYKWDSYPASSWEKVANDEMWHSKISSAFFMYDQGEKADIPMVKTRLLKASYQLYFDAIKKNQKASKMNHQESFPSFWHKNFALVLERLLHEEHNLPKGQLCKQSISHFQQYVSAAPKDEDVKGILDAIYHLQQQLSTFEQLDAAMLKVNDITKKYVDRGNKKT